MVRQVKLNDFLDLASCTKKQQVLSLEASLHVLQGIVSIV